MTICDPVAEGPHTETLGRVVPRRHIVDPILGRLVHDPLGGLAGDVGVETRRDRLVVFAFGGPGDDSHRFDHPPVTLEDLRLAIGDIGDCGEEVLGVHRFGEDTADPGGCSLVLGKRLELDQTELTSELGGVSQLHVPVEGEVVRDQRNVVGQKQPNPFPKRAHQPRWFGAVPQHAVVNDDGVRFTIGSPRKQRPRRRHCGDDPLNIGRSLDLETIGAVVPDGIRLEEFVEIGHELKEVHVGMVPQQE